MTRRLVTHGERLFHFMCTQIDIPPPFSTYSLTDFAKRTGRIAVFADGAIRYHAFARVVKLGRTIRMRDDLPSEVDKSRELRRICLSLMDIGDSNCRDMTGFLELVLDTVAQINRPVTRTTKREVLENILSRGTDIKCYMCGEQLDVSAAQVLVDPELAGIKDDAFRDLIQRKVTKQHNPKFVEYEHLWPNSMGGDSVPDNLLLSCPYCNRGKKDLVSWEWAIVQASILPPVRYDADVFTHVPKLTKIALFTRAAFLLADEQGQSLKESFLALGPKQDPRAIDDEDTTDFFNMVVHDSDKLGSLWEI